MSNTIPNLWPSTLLKPSVLSPTAILSTQAAFVSQGTNGLLNAQVTVETQENRIILSFDVIAPALRNYRHRLLSVEYTPEAIYPALITGPGLVKPVTKTVQDRQSIIAMASGSLPTFSRVDVFEKVGSKTVASEAEFSSAVQEVLSAQETVSLLQSLIIRSNDASQERRPTSE